MVESTHQFISIRTVTDHHLEEYLKCPYRFYIRHIRKKATTPIHWRQLVQHTVNKVIQEYYQQPRQGRNSYTVLKLIDKHWSKSTRFFDSEAHYYTTLAKVTDYLLQWLTSHQNIHPPIFLFEKFFTTIEELQINLSIVIQVGEWSEKSFVIKKILVDDDEQIIHAYKHIAVVFCQRAFQALPERIEIYSLSTGQTHLFHPQNDDIQQGIRYLQLVKDLFKDSTNYIRTESSSECDICLLKDHCHSHDNVEKIERKVN